MFLTMKQSTIFCPNTRFLKKKVYKCLTSMLVKNDSSGEALVFLFCDIFGNINEHLRLINLFLKIRKLCHFKRKGDHSIEEKAGHHGPHHMRKRWEVGKKKAFLVANFHLKPKCERHGS